MSQKLTASSLVVLFITAFAFALPHNYTYGELITHVSQNLANEQPSPRTDQCTAPQPTSSPSPVFFTPITSSSGRTQITNAVDYNGNLVCNNGSTSSNSIHITFSAVIPQGTSQPTATLQCSIDNQAFINCSSPAAYTNLAIGTHTFQVRAVFSDGTTDTPATFTWTVTTSTGNTTFPSADTSATDQQTLANTLSQLQTQNLGRSSAIASQAQGAEAASADQKSATATATVLNPPLKPCGPSPMNADLAIYKILGHANMKELLKNADASQQVPVSIIMYMDTLPGPDDLKNLVVDYNNPFIVGKIVVFPNDVNRQKAVTFQLDKISTDCKIVTLVNPADILGIKTSNGQNKPAVLISQRADPPLQPCFQPTTATSTLATAGQTTTQSSLAPSALINTNTGGQNSLTLAVTGTGAGTETGTPNPTNDQSVQNGGPSDVAKYVIRGTFNKNDLTSVSSSQSVLLTIVNDLLPYAPPQNKVAKVLDSNNQFAASIQVNPGEDPRKWQKTFLELTEISTTCKAIPFVDRPMEIVPGKKSEDYVQDPTGAHITVSHR